MLGQAGIGIEHTPYNLLTYDVEVAGTPPMGGCCSGPPGRRLQIQRHTCHSAPRGAEQRRKSIPRWILM
ncbi:hypothetical protein VN97_g7571 [Penicillium thymicola]|uniref:Uncharacterized protein n=1 Tax=Penicillium thymicola TaxID=293382 RepID=A0AAI9TEB5_PENTH|nr:hypothetical protein VN97_g7571 [Penicillium thymicola]